MITWSKFCDKYHIPEDLRYTLAYLDLPRWSTPERRECLVKLWHTQGNKCLYGHTACPVKEHYRHFTSKLVNAQQAETVKCLNSQGLPLKDKNGNQLYVTVYRLHKVVENHVEHDRLYDVKSEDIIQYWIDEDRDSDRYNWEVESEILHRTSDRKFPIRGQFSGIARDIWHDTQPLFYIEHTGINALTFKPFAKIRLASSGTRLYVDISEVLRPLSKHARRKAIRYSKSSNAIENEIQSMCYKSVKQYLNS